MSEIPFKVGGHEWTEYRPAGTSRHETPADVCITCSDNKGTLVPMSFCLVFAPLVEEEYRKMFDQRADDTYDSWNVSWKTFDPANGEQTHNRGFPFHADANDFSDTLEDNPDAYDIRIWDA